MAKSKQRKNKPTKTTKPVYLGLPDEPCEAGNGNDLFSTVLGGLPTWLNTKCPPPSNAAVCDHCQNLMPLVLQTYAPLDTSCYERVLYLWGCNRQACMGHPGSFKALRGHQYNEEYAKKLNRSNHSTTVTQKATPKPSIGLEIPSTSSSSAGTTSGFDLGDLWGGGFKKPSSNTTGSGSKEVNSPGLISSSGNSGSKHHPIEKVSPHKASDGMADLIQDTQDMVLGSSDSDFSESDFDSLPVSTNPHAKVRVVSQGKPSPPRSELPFVMLSDALETRLSHLGHSTTPSDQEGDGQTWSEVHPTLPGTYLYVTEEVLDTWGMESSFDTTKYQQEIQELQHLLTQSTNVDRSSRKKLNSSGTNQDPSWVGETYERDQLPSGMDKGLQRFTERVSQWPEQCIRYDFAGIPLLYNYSDAVARLMYSRTPESGHAGAFARASPRYTTSGIPPCQHCGATRVFECQLMPNALLTLGTERHARQPNSSKHPTTSSSASKSLPPDLATHGMEWGTVMLFCCPQDCHLTANRDPTQEAYFQECVVVQKEM
ncbi:hypothetical protein IWQ62_004279 [Dispira parvispora]|uniref:Programmed cell death protein 2 C-terminal domain-containing protein n=1 Tax=Dispira parvispora TaxID=1520584 RepID=A0A9W8E250_9FUNG|nr:hypothetical protein IWQ62_004279 [Dispira parvispora]